MKEPVDHILRPQLPWRLGDGAITECGYDATQVKTLTRGQYFARLKDLGQQRSAMLTCMTCSNTAGRWRGWEGDPREALQRVIEWERGGRYSYGEDKRGGRLRDELVALKQLIEAHRDEFDALVAEIADRREWNAKKQRMAERPKTWPRGL